MSRSGFDGVLRHLRPDVPVVKTPDTGQADHAGGRGGPGLDWTTIGRVVEAGVDPLGAVGHIVSEQTPELRFPEDDYVIEKLAPAGPDPALGDGVLPGAAVRRAHGIDPKAPDRGHDLR